MQNKKKVPNNCLKSPKHFNGKCTQQQDGKIHPMQILQANNLLSTKLKPKYCQLESASGYNSLIGERIEMQLRLSLWPSDGILPSMH